MQKAEYVSGAWINLMQREADVGDAGRVEFSFELLTSEGRGGGFKI